MTLDEAIRHAFEKAEDKKCSINCRADHRQLGKWLSELKKYRSEKSTKCLSWNDTHTDYSAVLKKKPIHSGKFSVAFQYIDDNGIRHWKTGWYSNRSNFVDDFAVNFHEGSES